MGIKLQLHIPMEYRKLHFSFVRTSKVHHVLYDEQKKCAHEKSHVCALTRQFYLCVCSSDDTTRAQRYYDIREVRISPHTVVVLFSTYLRFKFKSAIKIVIQYI